MSLSSYKVRTSIAVSDLARATDFYEGTLGLTWPTSSRWLMRSAPTA
jgi:predicted enzyme related to lactoylglutathione lyase